MTQQGSKLGWYGRAIAEKEGRPVPPVYIWLPHAAMVRLRELGITVHEFRCVRHVDQCEEQQHAG